MEKCITFCYNLLTLLAEAVVFRHVDIFLSSVNGRPSIASTFEIDFYFCSFHLLHLQHGVWR